MSYPNDINIHRYGSTVYRDMIKEIRDAEEEINLEYYIFSDDKTGRLFIKELKKASERGVKVRIIIDGFGSSKFPYHRIKELRESGVNIRYYNPVQVYKGVWRWVFRDHRKIISIDNRVGYLGGMNIHHRHLQPEDLENLPPEKSIKDTQVRIEGPKARDIRNRFGQTWKMLTGEEFSFSEEEENRNTRILGGKLRHQNNALKDYIRKFRKAENYIHLTQAYFVPPEYIRKELYRAVNRGVDVKVVVPGIFDILSVRSASKHLYREMVKKGVSIHEYQNSFIHSKTGVVDGEWTGIGSLNIDYQSVLRNLELNISTEQEKVVEEMENHFRKDLENSEKVTLKDIEKRRSFEKFRNWFFYKFRWIY